MKCLVYIRVMPTRLSGMNEKLKAKGYRTICGKIPTKYFEKNSIV